MLTSRLYAGGVQRGRLATSLDRMFRRLTEAYRDLAHALHPLALDGCRTARAGRHARRCAVHELPGEYAPAEDRNMMLMTIRGPEGASPEYMDRQVRVIEGLLKPYVEAGEIKRVVSRTGMWGSGGDVNTAFIYMPLVSRADAEALSPGTLGRNPQQVEQACQVPSRRSFCLPVWPYAPVDPDWQ